MKILRFTLAVSSLLAAVGCSGAAPQLVEQAPADTAGGTTGSTAPASGSSSSNSGGSGSSSAGGGSSTGSGAGGTTSGGSGGTTTPPSTGDAGSSTGPSPDPTGGGGGFDAGPAPDQCPQGATHQSNWGGGSEHSATRFDGTACGMLSPGRTYWWTFTLSSTATNLAVNFSGNVQVTLFSNGTSVDVVPGAMFPFNPGADYDLEVTSISSQDEPYVIVVTTN